MAGDDRDGLEAELVVLVHTVRGLVDALAKADPNPYGPTYVDPVVWGVTVAPFAVSINPEAPSPGGTAAPLFQVLDAFLGRRAYDSLLGKEVQRLHNVAPPLQRAFVDAVAEMPLGAFLARAGTPTLRGLARALMEVYAGGQGLLQAHRIKAYGYLEVAFKVGRPITLSGFEGVFRERPWKQVDDALDASMRERNTDGLDTWVSRATLAQRGVATPTRQAHRPRRAPAGHRLRARRPHRGDPRQRSRAHRADHRRARRAAGHRREAHRGVACRARAARRGPDGHHAAARGLPALGQGPPAAATGGQGAVRAVGGARARRGDRGPLRGPARTVGRAVDDDRGRLRRAPPHRRDAVGAREPRRHRPARVRAALLDLLRARLAGLPAQRRAHDRRRHVPHRRSARPGRCRPPRRRFALAQPSHERRRRRRAAAGRAGLRLPAVRRPDAPSRDVRRWHRHLAVPWLPRSPHRERGRDRRQRALLRRPPRRRPLLP